MKLKLFMVNENTYKIIIKYYVICITILSFFCIDFIILLMKLKLYAVNESTYKIITILFICMGLVLNCLCDLII